ncbi:MAG: hypothetical protein ABFS21_12940 [Actinomycetota bacterium]
MAGATGMSRIETDAYRSRFDDGLLDLFIGIALLWMGVSWLWFEDLAPMSGVLPAVLVMPFVPLRTRFIESRAGYVKFSESRRQWERRNLVLFVAVGLLMFALAIGAYVAFRVPRSIAPGLIAFLLALMVGLIAFASVLPRFLVYTGLLFVGGVVAAIFETNPGAPLLVAGVIVTVWGAVLTTRFVRSHPKAEVV